MAGWSRGGSFAPRQRTSQFTAFGAGTVALRGVGNVSDTILPTGIDPRGWSRNGSLLVRSRVFGGGMPAIVGNSEELGLGSKQPPIAPRIVERLEAHGHVREDPYFWLRNREDPRVLDHLRAENEYTESVLEPERELRESLYREIRARIREEDSSVPFRRGDWWYSSRFEQGAEYRLHCRRRGSPEAPEQVYLDETKLAEGHEFFELRGLEMSPNHCLLAYAEDLDGSRICTLRFKDLESGALLPDAIPEASGAVAWANDNATVLYVRLEPDTLREAQIYRHRLGTSVEDDQLVFEERDVTFSCTVSRSRSQRYLIISSHQTVSTEHHLLDAEQPDGHLRVVHPRERDHEYHVEHFGDQLYILTNWQARNFRLMTVSDRDLSRSRWQELIGHRTDVLLDDFEMFRNHLVLEERFEGLTRLTIRRLSDGQEHPLPFEEPAYGVWLGDNEEPDTDRLRLVYSSLRTPPTVYDYDMESGEKTLLKRQEVLGDFDRKDYVVERLQAVATDGTSIPISLVCHRAFETPGPRPLLLVGYGAYGISMEPTFSAARLSLLNRGFVYAMAHVRGGQELGRAWYESGRLEHKQNTFTDFIACAEFLIDQKRTAPDCLYAQGGSAGGLLMGAVMHLRPDLFHGIVADVPFVDVVTTMLDDSIPLTAGEYDEWGNPRVEEDYHRLLSYSPYDQVRAEPRPHLLVTTGLHDSQVQYWEPAKWIAKLRAHQVDDRLLLLKTNLEAGHSGPSGRFEFYREIALDYAFLMRLAQAKDVSPPARKEEGT